MKDKAILIISGLGFLVALWLTVSEASAGDCCPDFPFTAVPACYIVLVLYGLVFVSRFVKKSKIKTGLAVGAGIIGLFIAVFFSLNQILGLQQCPQLFYIPLCFLSLIAFLLILILVAPER